MTPQLISTVAELRSELDRRRALGHTIGLVPTMGYLHAGHGSLMQAAGETCDTVAASIYVNPLQFGAGEDLSSYPRDLQRDTEIAAGREVDILFVPTEEELHPLGPPLTEINVPSLASVWEGASRPTHFVGVATIVNTLLNIVGPCAAFFGEKDFQQLAIINRMVADLSLPVEIIGCPTVREPDGLAMSSRNSYLTRDEREAAAILRLALDAGEAVIKGGAREPQEVIRAMGAVVNGEPLAKLDYATVVDPATLEIPPVLMNDVRLLIAAQVGRTRLIDNCGVSIHGDPT